MNPVNFSNAANAYKDALRAAQNILEKTSLPGMEGPKEVAGSSSFLDMLAGGLQETANLSRHSENVAMKQMAGKADIADVVLAVNNAETALNTVVAVRDRVITAYQDIIKMPI